MNSDTYRFTIGSIDCLVVSDGSLTYAPPIFPPPEVLLFSNASKESLEATLGKYSIPVPWKEWVSPYICLAVNTGKKLILVDSGAGGLAPTTGKLIHNLQAQKITPGDIDMVFITHGHPDHLGGNTNDDGKPAFPNARYVISKNEWDFWTSGQAEQKLDEHSRAMLIQIAHKNLLPIKSQIDLVDGDTEIAPGIHAVSAPGHTPGLMALAISSKNDRLLCISDVVLHPAHLERVEWSCVFDTIPELVSMTRREYLERAAKEKALVMAFHFPFPGLGHVLREGNTWKWQPITPNA